MDVINQFLENTTIHGLSYIANGKSIIVKVIWFIFVSIAFGCSFYLIHSSYSDWESAPVATTITTHPISNVPFPKVTVCPPLGSNTALNNDMLNLDNSLTAEKKLKLLNGTEEVFVHEHHMKHVERINAVVNPKNIRLFLENIATFGEDFDVKIGSSKGSITSPYYDSLIEADKVRQDYSLHYIIQLPEQYAMIIGGGRLWMNLTRKTSNDERVVESLRWLGPRWEIHREVETWEAAQAVCRGQGGHLASLHGEQDWEEMRRSVWGTEMKTEKTVWLGGTDRDEEGVWTWTDETPWDFQYWAPYGREVKGKSGLTQNCLSASGDGWYDNVCSAKHPFVCTVPPHPQNGSLTVSWGWNEVLFPSLHIWWNHSVDSWSLLDTEQRIMSGFQLDWWLEDREEQILNITGNVHQLCTVHYSTIKYSTII